MQSFNSYGSAPVSAPVPAKGKEPAIATWSTPPQPSAYPTKEPKCRPPLSSATFARPQTALNTSPQTAMRTSRSAGGAPVLEGPGHQADGSSTTWTSSSAEQALLSEGEGSDDREQFMQEYNRLAKQYGVRLSVPGYILAISSSASMSLPDRKGSWFSRVLRHASSGQPPQSATVKSHRSHLPHRRSISDVALNLVHHQRRDGLKDESLPALVRLCGKSLFYLPTEYAPCSLVLPTCFRALAQALVQQADAPGIFRVPGSIRVVNSLYDYYCADRDTNDISSTTRCPTLPKHIRCGVHDVASTFKRFLAGLPGGILGSLSLFDALVAIHSQLYGEAESNRTKQTKLRARMIALALGAVKSRYQRELICAVFGLLCLVGRAAETAPREDEGGRPLPTSDRMGYNALGIVFGPLLLGDLIDSYSMKVADPSTGLILLPATPPKLRKGKHKKSKCRVHKAAPSFTVDKIHVANNITEMLITHWREVVRHMRSVGSLKMRKATDKGDHRGNRGVLRSSASDSFALRLPPDWADHRPYARGRGESVSPVTVSPTPTTRARSLKTDREFVNPTLEPLHVKRRRSRPSRSESPQTIVMKTSAHVLSPTVEEGPFDCLVNHTPRRTDSTSFTTIYHASEDKDATLLASQASRSPAAHMNRSSTKEKRATMIQEVEIRYPYNPIANPGKVDVLQSKVREQRTSSSSGSDIDIRSRMYKQPAFSTRDESSPSPTFEGTSKHDTRGEEPKTLNIPHKGPSSSPTFGEMSKSYTEHEEPETSNLPVKGPSKEQLTRRGSPLPPLRASEGQYSTATRDRGPSSSSMLKGTSKHHTEHEGPGTSNIPRKGPSKEQLTPRRSPLPTLQASEGQGETIPGNSDHKTRPFDKWVPKCSTLPALQAPEGQNETILDDSDHRASPLDEWETVTEQSKVSTESQTRLANQRGLARSTGYFSSQQSQESLSTAVEKPTTPEWKRQLVKKRSQQRQKPAIPSPERKTVFEKSSQSSIPQYNASPAKVKGLSPAKNTLEAVGSGSISSISQRSTSRPANGAVKAMAALFDNAIRESPRASATMRTYSGLGGSNSNLSQYTRSNSPTKSVTTTMGSRTTTPARTSGPSKIPMRRLDNATPRTGMGTSNRNNVRQSCAPPVVQTPTRFPHVSLRPTGSFTAAMTQPQGSPSQQIPERDRETPGLGTMVPPREEPPVAHFIRPNSTVSFRLQNDIDDDHRPGLGPRTQSGNSVLHAQIRTLQRRLENKNEEIFTLRRQLETSENMDVGTLSEQLRQAKRECQMWRDRAGAAERRIAVFERFLGRFRGMRDAADREFQESQGGITVTGEESTRPEHGHGHGHGRARGSGSSSCSVHTENQEVLRDRIRGSIIQQSARRGGGLDGTEFGGDEEVFGRTPAMGRSSTTDPGRVVSGRTVELWNTAMELLDSYEEEDMDMRRWNY
ncbi:Uu.00g090800.m01.CDS01 [Anthostomella pinea]|uniref:Uu.00g090800.m01.CDS01 n=1 Tax=Anthostomella pinea TaxID=933095 RepID=A0AAI8VN04_9PEZI|nr:Uu.00g090800.m01.CDS01 [Anthostomella pinea]